MRMNWRNWRPERIQQMAIAALTDLNVEHISPTATSVRKEPVASAKPPPGSRIHGHSAGSATDGNMSMPPLELRPPAELGDGDSKPPLQQVPPAELEEDDTRHPLEQVRPAKVEDNDFTGSDHDQPSYVPEFRCRFQLCGAKFISEVRLIRHQNAKGHHFCVKCERGFRSWVSLLQHLTDSAEHNFCLECEEDLPTPEALRYHLTRSWAHLDFCTCTNVLICLAGLVALVAVLESYNRGLLHKFYRDVFPELASKLPPEPRH